MFAAWNASATECASVKFLNDMNGEQVVELAAVDAELLDFVDRYSEHRAKKVNDGSYQHYFEPGNYSLLLRVWDRNFFKTISHIDKSALVLNYKRGIEAYNENRLGGNLPRKNTKYLKNEAIISQFIKEVPIELTVEKNKSYSINLKVTGETFEFEQPVVSDASCDSGTSELHSKSEIETKFVSDLTPYLQYRLENLVDKLAKYQSNQAGVATSIVPMGNFGYFGAVLGEVDGEQKGVQVLSVLPYSLASYTGFASGDILVEIGGGSVELDSQAAKLQLNSYLVEQVNGDDVEFTVLRNGQELALEHEYESLYVPQSTYTIQSNVDAARKAVTKNTPLPTELQFEYDLMLMELNEHFADELEDNNLELIGSSFVSKKYGIKGRLKNKSVTSPIEVTEVTKGSTADLIGLQVGDEVHKINGLTIEHRARPFFNAVSKLENGLLRIIGC